MFVSQPEYEFPFPPVLGQPGSQHWRMMELSLHVPWFMVSVEHVDAANRESGVTRTLCIALDHDLVEVLRSLIADRVRGIVCMMPAYQSANGQWTSREVREVWTCSSAIGESVLLRDAGGQEFDCGLVPEHVGPVHNELVLQVAQGRQRARQPTLHKASAASGRRS